MYFIIFRRVWLVEDPLPMPGFEATLKMLDISSDVSSGSAEAARESLRTVGVWTVLTMGLMFVIDYPIRWSKKIAGVPSSIADWFAMTLSGEKWGLASVYTERWIHQPSELVEGQYAPYGGITTYEKGNPMSYTFLGVELSPTLFAIGWFMKFRAALLVNLGAILAWFWLIPLAVLQVLLPLALVAAAVGLHQLSGAVPLALHPLALVRHAAVSVGPVSYTHLTLPTKA